MVVPPLPLPLPPPLLLPLLLPLDPPLLLPPEHAEHCDMQSLHAHVNHPDHSVPAFTDAALEQLVMHPALRFAHLFTQVLSPTQFVSLVQLFACAEQSLPEAPERHVWHVCVTPGFASRPPPPLFDVPPSSPPPPPPPLFEEHAAMITTATETNIASATFLDTMWISPRISNRYSFQVAGASLGRARHTTRWRCPWCTD
jgi:hypothetical protein